ncbi:MAG TPA: SIR2 family protein [Blastocatellia bacterium]|nr:SIR2 family protein [Blastocatellia bacterium]
MAGTKIKEDHWGAIIKRIDKGRCVPFLGAGVNVSSKVHNYDGLLLGTQVALSLVVRMLHLSGAESSNLENAIRRQSLDQYRGRTQAALKALEEDLQALLDKATRVLNNELPAGQAQIDKDHFMTILRSILPDDVEDNLAHIIIHQELNEYKDLTNVSLLNLARVAQYIRYRVDFTELIDHLRNILPDDAREPSPLLRTLARLPFGLIVTTNYDRLMERALEEAGRKEVYSLHQPTKGFSPAQQARIPDELADFQTAIKEKNGVVLYKIHGTFAGDKESDQSHIIITEEDYIDFLNIIGRENVGIPNTVKATMVNSTLLFLGYSLEDWDFRTIYKGLIESLPDHQQRISFAIQKDPPEFWENFWQDKKVVIYNVDLYEFAAELEERYENYKTKGRV